MRVLLATAFLALYVNSADAQTTRRPALENLFSDLRSAFGSPQQPHPAVVRVTAPERDAVGYGSGTLVDVNQTHGLIVTNWHVVADAAGPITVTFPDGSTSPAQVLKMDRDWDLAALAIRRPKATPVRLARQAPRPGEFLTIAGYGSGSYREATGRCTQYVAPGTNLPYEMVELSAAARQGDSGGPIFNEQGELAGVLFGEGGGHTSGSYQGRVHAFLTSMSADLARAAAMMPAPTPSQPAPSQPAPTSAPPFDPPPAPVASTPPYTPPPIEQNARRFVVRDAPWAMASHSSASATDSATSTAQAATATTEEDAFGWHHLTGRTPIEQAKAALALVGALALLIHGARWFRASS